MALRIVEAASATDVGRQRHTNEDDYLEAAPVFAVADGMGGARAGEVASRIAIEALGDERDRSASPEAQLDAAAQEANRRIYELALEDESHAGMGTTFTAAMLTGNEVAVGHVGDSRLYRLRDDELERLSQDHSLVEEWVRQGKLSPEAAESHPQRSIITRALGPEPQVEIETFTCPGKHGDVYLLCSDGLTGMVAEERVAQMLRARSSLRQVAQELVDTANEAGGKDNITVVLFQLGSDVERDPEFDTPARDTVVGVAAPGRGPGPEDTATAQGRARPPGRGGDGVPESTLSVDSATADALRAREAERSGMRRPAPPVPERSSSASASHRGRRERRPRRRGRRAWRALATLVVLAIAVAGAYFGGRQVFFLGANDRGLVTLYRGLPFDLPFDVSLYQEEYASTVPAASLPPRQRDAVLDHQLRGQGDAVDLVRTLERTATAP